VRSSAPRPATEAGPEELLERVQRLRQELLRRGEFLAPAWADEAARDLRQGTLLGWCFPADGAAPGLAFFSARERRVYAHLHIEPGPERTPRALALLGTLIAGWGPGIVRADVGLSGLEGEEEAHLAREALARFGGEVFLRHALERPSSAAVIDPPAPAVPGRRVALGAVSLDGLAALDWRAFQGSPDERLIADTPAEGRRSLAELLEGRLGRVVPEASGGFVDPSGTLLGFILSAGTGPGRVMVLDLAVDPPVRRRGIAGYLLGTALDALRAEPARTVRLWVTEGNRPARALYDRFGFHLAQSARVYRWLAGAPSAPETSPSGSGPGSAGRPGGP
jgi:ribosomal protein S18 acetylase RimI-like enzyme